ncbi:MAG: hypothetical protein Q4C63_06445 [Eubacteriales bacterium]|nr:hypothetical protein [Eubacteriales bacterium]
MKKSLLAAIAMSAAILSLTGCHKHEFGEWEIITPAGCTTDGTQERVCKCGEKETETIPAAGHSFGEWEVVNAATCTEDGEEIRTCSACEETETQVIPAKGHSFKAATLFAPKTCTACGLTEGEALGKVAAIGEEQSAETYKFTITDISFTSKVSERRGSVTYSLSDGYYLAIRMSFTNLSNEAVEKWNSDRVSDMTLQYAGKFDYEGEFRILVDDIVPLDTQNAYVVYSVPESMGTDDGKSVMASFKVDGDTYVVTIREGAADASESASSKGTASGDGDSDTGAASAVDTETELSVGDTRTDGENFSFVLDQIYFAKEVSEKKGSTTYSSSEGNYLVLKLSFTNLANAVVEKWNSDRVSDMTLKFDDKYDYEGEFTVLADDIVPLDTRNAYIMYSVPDSLETSDGSLNASFKIDGYEFHVNCREE